MISYKDYIEYQVVAEDDYIRGLIEEGYFGDIPMKNATDEQIRKLAEMVVDGLNDCDYLNMVHSECELDEIKYQIELMFPSSKKD